MNTYNNTSIVNNLRIIPKEIKPKMKLKVGKYVVKPRFIGLVMAIIFISNYGINVSAKNKNNFKQVSVDTTYQETTYLDLEKDEDTLKVLDLFEEEAFHFSYEDRSQNISFQNAKKYEDIFKKYAKKYGLDANLLMAIAAQESSGNHYDNLEKQAACGIMQIEKKVWIGETIKAYNFEEEKLEKFKITKDNIKDLDTNIKIGAMYFRDCLDSCNNNIVLALQRYNYGAGNINKVLDSCSKNENITIDNIKRSPTYNKWLNYRNVINVGDENYIEHVLSYFPDNTISIRKRDNSIDSLKIINDYSKENNKSL